MEEKQNKLTDLLIGCKLNDVKYDKYKEDNALDRASELEELGFDKVAQDILVKTERLHKLAKTTQYGYIRVMPTKIKEYLKELADRYDKEHPKKKKKNNGDIWDYINGGQYSAWAQQAQALTFTDLQNAYIAIDPAYSGTSTTTLTSKHKPEQFTERTNDYISDSKKTIGQYVYTETPIDQYNEIPPQETLRTLKEHKNRHIFDYFTIAKVSHIPDPILFGRIDGCEDRFYICQWGNDITLDDII